MNRAYYSDSISGFASASDDEILGRLAAAGEFALEQTQREAWREEIRILRSALAHHHGTIHFEFSIPRMGRRADVVLVVGPVIFVLEFKVGERGFNREALDQVVDYALDLKNFHEPSHNRLVAPVLIATKATNCPVMIEATQQRDGLFQPMRTNGSMLGGAIAAVLSGAGGEPIEPEQWRTGRYCPTPTIIEAALALYGGHSVAEISRSDASARNLSQTSQSISSIIEAAKAQSRKVICFVTGVPGAGKTLVGLNMATLHMREGRDAGGVFLSGNQPLVRVLLEALARDQVRRRKDRNQRMRIGEARSQAKTFIQNVHHFRDECRRDSVRPPVEHVVIFDEAQRAWTFERTAGFMHRRKGVPNFGYSEPEFLISSLNRHQDWAVIVCLVGGGQEINRGEAGIKEWIGSLVHGFPEWHIYISPHLTDSEYSAGDALRNLQGRANVFYKDDLHLGVSVRSFRAEKVSLLIKQVLDLDVEQARKTFKTVGPNYPILLTRDLRAAKKWLRYKARGSERYGIVVSSQAERLKPDAINVRAPLDPIHWFLDPKEDVRSSYYLEDAATEFHVQGLELDWACVTWDGDFRYSNRGWEHWSFCGDRWRHIRQPERQNYLKNAYRVLLTRARQGMIIVVPPGDKADKTRCPEFYDSTFEYLKGIGLSAL